MQAPERAGPEYSVLELCKNRAGYEAVPSAEVKLKLHDVERDLKEAGFEPLANAGILPTAENAPLRSAFSARSDLPATSRVLP